MKIIYLNYNLPVPSVIKRGQIKLKQEGVDAAQLAEEEGEFAEQGIPLEPRSISAFQTKLSPKLSSPSTPIQVTPCSFSQETGSLKPRMRPWLCIIVSPDR